MQGMQAMGNMIGLASSALKVTKPCGGCIVLPGVFFMMPIPPKGSGHLPHLTNSKGYCDPY